MPTIAGLETGLDLGGFAASSIGMYIMIFLVAVVGIGIAGGVIWWYLQQRLYKFDIVVFENISGKGWGVSMKDRARYLRLSKDGTEVFWLKKKKMPLTAYGKKMGTNQYWFAIGQDGGWYNIVLGDLDAKMGTLDIEPVDRDIKYVSVAMRKNAAENYGPQITFMDRYGSWILGGVTLIILMAGGWFLIEQMGNTAQALTSATSEFSKVVEPITRALAHVDSICSGGSGITPA